MANCQAVLSELTKSVKEFENALAIIAAPDQTISLKLDHQQLGLFLCLIDKKAEKVSVVVEDQTNNGRLVAGQIKAWDSVFHVKSNWQYVTGTLSKQEQEGLVHTLLTQVLHSVLFNRQDSPARVLIPAQFLKDPLPDPVLYEAAVIRLSAAEQITVHELATILAAQGYLRHRTTLEPGSFRVRGEQIDVAHPLLPGHYTITFYRHTIESIVHHIPPRTHRVKRIALPPVRFPQQNASWHTLLKEQIVIRPAYLNDLQGQQTIIYDALRPEKIFPYYEYRQHTPAVDTKQIIIFYENLERARLASKAYANHTVHLCHAAERARSPLNLTNNTHVLLSEAHLAPQETTNPISLQEGLALIQELRHGMPAVHSEHGIGIYEGLQQRTISGIKREYLVLRYADGDAISVPVEFAHKISSYLGTDNPPINRLGEGVWLKVRHRAQRNAHLMARELLKTASSRAQQIRPPYQVTETLEQELLETFPYPLTPDQARTLDEVHGDLKNSRPMDRLIVGDVGFGKTEIAIRAAAHVVANDQQVALLAPTTLLVQQHYDTLINRLPRLSEKIGRLSRFMSGAEQRKTKQKIAEGNLAIIVGTHALLSSDTAWKKLGLVIIDEEQRFGVQHKEHFKTIRAAVDILSLSATPIPRTLYMALGGLKNLSVISTPPADRQETATHVGPDNNNVIRHAIDRELSRNGQIYIVAPKISQLHTLNARIKRLFPKPRIGIVHARLDDRNLADIMQQFDRGNIDILLSSTIIENGLDLPNANTIIVYDAASFGLADLYQLRGRIGRRNRQGYAYFLYRQHALKPVQRQRLAALTEASRLGSGWQLAQRDLELRGAGSMFGAEQSGSLQQVGLQLYADLVREEIAGQQGSKMPKRETEIHLPLSSLIPPHYIGDFEERTRWYQRLARTVSIKTLEKGIQAMEKIFGPLPAETKNLELILQLQCAAAECGITKITSRTITPPGKKAYERLEIHARNIPELLGTIGHAAEWTVRGEILTCDTDKITPAYVDRLIKAFRE